MGGKNPFEALALGVLVVHGPQTGNFREAYSMLNDHGAALQVTNARELGAAVVRAQNAAFRAPYLHAASTVLKRTMAPLEAAYAAVTDALPPTTSERGEHRS